MGRRITAPICSLDKRFSLVIKSHTRDLAEKSCVEEVFVISRQEYHEFSPTSRDE
jgi:hypothetical protein